MRQSPLEMGPNRAWVVWYEDPNSSDITNVQALIQENACRTSEEAIFMAQQDELADQANDPEWDEEPVLPDGVTWYAVQMPILWPRLHAKE